MTRAVITLPPAPPVREVSLPTGARLGGGIFVLNAIASGLAWILATAAQTGSVITPVIALFDLMVGGALLLGSLQALPLARIRVLVGGIVLPYLYVSAGQNLVGWVQLVFSASLLALLLGQAGVSRIALGVMGAALLVGLEGLGVAAAVTGTNPLAPLIMGRQLEARKNALLWGDKHSYRIMAPKARWYLRSAQRARADNRFADRWLVRPDVGAHVIVTVETHPPGTKADMKQFGWSLVANAQASADDVRIIRDTALSHGLPARLIHTQSRRDEVELEGYTAMFVGRKQLYQIFAYAPRRQFALLDRELMAIIESFEGY